MDLAGTDTTINTIGGTAKGAGNVISANFGYGIVLSMGASSNAIQGNFIGTDTTGSIALGNSRDGIEVVNSANNTIGGISNTKLATIGGAGNIIANNSGNGITLTAGASANLVQGNSITSSSRDGLALTGIGTTNNVIGGTEAGAGNVIIGTGGNGISLAVSASGNLLEGNQIHNSANDGVHVEAASNNTIGGASPGAGNLISESNGDGIILSTSSSENLIEGCQIDVNSGDGVEISAGSSGNTIGGTQPAAGNMITTNIGDGVVIEGFLSQQNSVKGNLIFFNRDGVSLVATLGNLIGGTEDGAGNTITRNLGNGITLTASASSNEVQGNFIGTNAAGDSVQPNGQDGVNLSGIATDFNIIGGTLAAARNVISGNFGNGISLTAGRLEQSGAGQLHRHQCVGLRVPPQWR